jgi:carbamoyl-phosphate synthase large subunit
VFPFIKFPGVDTILGPEMKSTGEVMGVGETFGEAFIKSQLAAGVKLPRSGRVFISLKNSDKPRAVEIARTLVRLGFELVATRGTAAALAAAGVPVSAVNKVAEGRPHIVDMLKNDEIALVVNTVEEKRSAIQDSYAIRRAALTDQVPTITTISGARATAVGLAGAGELMPYSIQALHSRLPAPAPRPTEGIRTP